MLVRVLTWPIASLRDPWSIEGVCGRNMPLKQFQCGSVSHVDVLRIPDRNVWLVAYPSPRTVVLACVCVLSREARSRTVDCLVCSIKYPVLSLPVEDDSRERSAVEVGVSVRLPCTRKRKHGRGTSGKCTCRPDHRNTHDTVKIRTYRDKRHQEQKRGRSTAHRPYHQRL